MNLSQFKYNQDERGWWHWAYRREGRLIAWSGVKFKTKPEARLAAKLTKDLSRFPIITNRFF